MPDLDQSTQNVRLEVTAVRSHAAKSYRDIDTRPTDVNRLVSPTSRQEGPEQVKPGSEEDLGVFEPLGDDHRSTQQLDSVLRAAELIQSGTESGGGVAFGSLVADGFELACGRGRNAVWLARRGLEVRGVDVSPVAIGRARELAERSGVGARCRFDVVDLDGGLPDGPPVEVILCYFFRDARLDGQIVERLTRGGLLAIAVLSTVDVGPGLFRVGTGDLLAAFASLDVLVNSEGAGQAWLLARR